MVKTPSRRSAPRPDTGILRPSLVRGANLAAIVRLLIQSGPLPRKEIAQTLGLTQGPVTRIVAELADAGLVRELEAKAEGGMPGRPLVPIALNAPARTAIGVHIGIDVVTAGVVLLDGSVVDVDQAPYSGSAADAFDAAARLVRKLVGEAPDDGEASQDEHVLGTASAAHRIHRSPRTGLLGVGLIVGGWVDEARGALVRNDILGWADLPLADELQTRLGSTEIGDLVVSGNVRAHAYGDMLFGLARGVQDFVHVFVGNVFEAAVVVRGRLVLGPHDFGGDLSRWVVPGPHGHSVPARDVLIDPALVDKARAAGLLSAHDGFEDLVRLAHEGNATAADILAERARQVGAVVAEINQLIGPELIVVSSGVLALPEHLQLIEEAVDRPDGKTPRIVAGEYRPEALARAAAAIVFERYLETGVPD